MSEAVGGWRLAVGEGVRSIALFVTLLLLAGSVRADTPLIDQATLQKRLADKEAVIILDARSPQEFAEGHVPGAINVPYNYLPASISRLGDTSGKDIVIYCETGVRAERAASRLRENGFTRLLHLDGDMKAWREKQQPIEK